MPTPKDIFINCDILENIPQPNRENWLKEVELLKLELPQNARVLQIGSMDGTRIIHLLKLRPDLQITGLEIDAPLVELAQQNVAINYHKCPKTHSNLSRIQTQF